MRSTTIFNVNVETFDQKSEEKLVADLVRSVMWFALLSMLSVLIASTENGRNCDCRDGNGLVLTQTDFGEKQLSLHRSGCEI